MDIEEYRSQVETLLLQAVAEGKTKLTESEVLTMLADFSDDELDDFQRPCRCGRNHSHLGSFLNFSFRFHCRELKTEPLAFSTFER